MNKEEKSLQINENNIEELKLRIIGARQAQYDLIDYQYNIMTMSEITIGDFLNIKDRLEIFFDKINNLIDEIEIIIKEKVNYLEFTHIDKLKKY